MADNVPVTAGAGTSIASDDIGGVQFQRIKLIHGADGVNAGDVARSNPLPISAPDSEITGTIMVTDAVVAAPDGAGTLVTGASTALSLLALATPMGGDSEWAVQITGMTSGTLYFEASVNSTNGSDGHWINVIARRAGVLLTTLSGSATANGLYRGNLAGFKYFRVRSAGALVGTPAIVIRSSPGGGSTFLNSALPSGTNTIGAVTDGKELRATFRGRAQTFRTLGLAGTGGQKLFALHNATGSTKVVTINQLTVDLYQTVVKAVTVAPPLIRVHRFTAVPTGGTALAKVSKDTALATNASITAWGDTASDGGLSTTLAVTIPASNMLAQVTAARLITAAGYEMFDRVDLLERADVVLRPLEGIVVFLDYTLATQNPATDMWVVGCDWYEV